jgi:murein DD-endopeptidase MepM/ murein hydrolase activator NlpD
MAGLRLHLNTKDNEFYYAHLSAFAPGIKPGAKVKRGQIIGYSGSANGSPHLHLGVRSGDPRGLYSAKPKPKPKPKPKSRPKPRKPKPRR